MWVNADILVGIHVIIVTLWLSNFDNINQNHLQWHRCTYSLPYIRAWVPNSPCAFSSTFNLFHYCYYYYSHYFISVCLCGTKTWTDARRCQVLLWRIAEVFHILLNPSVPNRKEGLYYPSDLKHLFELLYLILSTSHTNTIYTNSTLSFHITNITIFIC